MKKEAVIELSQRIIPGKENFKLEIKIDDIAKTLPHTAHRADVWYILGEVSYCTHVSTHIEAPYHHLKEGLDIADYPVHRLIGNCVVMDFSTKKGDEAITLEEVKKYDTLIHQNDIVFIRNGMDQYFRSERWMEMSYLTEEATHWLIDQGIACLGTDAAGLEIPGTDFQPNHTALFKANIPVIESLTNLEKIENGKYLVFILPLAVEGLDASPVRVVAIRKEALRDELS
ncbi:MAG: cyclase family protein [Candidatus Atribacteria bacterium]|nr:cyclase family protein [Candidatus Atribacteria bacterium]